MAIRDLFRPKWQHWNSIKRIEAVNHLTNEDTLYKIAKNDLSNDVRIAAIKKITNPMFCIEIAKDRDYKIHGEASDSFRKCIDKLNDQFVLENLALNHPCSGIRTESVKKLNNESIVSDISVNDHDYGVRLFARERSIELKKIEVSNLSNEEELEKIVLSDLKLEIKAIAVGKIIDQNFLVKIVLSDLDSEIKSKAIDTITDQSILVSIAKNTNLENCIKLEAINKLTNQNVLEEIARTGIKEDIRIAAFRGLTDKEVLGSKLVMEHSLSVQKAILHRLSELGKIKELQIINNISSITDQSVLHKMAKKEPNPEVRKTLIEKITNELVLEEIALNEKNDQVRGFAVNKLTDKRVLVEIAKNDASWEIRVIANRKLGITHLALIDETLYGWNKDSAKQLVEIAKSNPKLLLDYWEPLRKKINKDKNHTDQSDHSDLTEGNGEHYDNGGSHQDSGSDYYEGIQFPRTPPNDII